jgi:hypothetical protein
MHRRSFLAATLSSFVPAAAPTWTADTNTNDGRPISGVKAGDVIIIYNSKDPGEIAAAQELKSFLIRMTKAQPRLTAEDSQASAASAMAYFLVGRTASSEALIASGKIGDLAKKNAEAYVVQSVNTGGKPGVRRKPRRGLVCLILSQLLTLTTAKGARKQKDPGQFPLEAQSANALATSGIRIGEACVVGG